MRHLAVGAARAAFNMLYRAARKTDRTNEVVFLSRQANNASFDFLQLAAEFERRGWHVYMHLKKVKKRNMVAYTLHVLKELRLLGRCKIAVLDRYDPVVSLLDFECDPWNGASAVNTDFPIKPVVLQLWHAFGAFKKFGHQSVGTLEGHSRDFTSTFSIHHNYSWVVCSGASARQGFAEAFACPPERVIAMDRPEYDELVNQRGCPHSLHDGFELMAAAETTPDAKQIEATKGSGNANVDTKSNKGMRMRLESGSTEDEKLKSTALISTKFQNDESSETHSRTQTLNVLMAPTLRKSNESAHPFRELYKSRSSFEPLVNAHVTWSFHPLEANLPAPGNVSNQLLHSDVLVTDYSSIVYEAYLLGVPVFFYIPDIASYRMSPGLNSDPLESAPEICAKTPDELISLLNAFAADPNLYPQTALERFASTAFDIDVPREGTAASRIVDFLLAHVQDSDRDLA